MKSILKSEFRDSFFAKIVLIFLIVLSVWWISMFMRNLTEGTENNAFTLIYPWLSLVGGIFGLYASRQWGGLKSAFGKCLTFLAVGLLLQFFGQAAYAYYIYIEGIEVPYPSLGDVGYFGSIILYILGALYIGKVTGIKFRLKSYLARGQALVIPIILLLLSYIIFLNNYELDPSQDLKTFLDFGYPFGQAVYVSIAISIILLSRKMLGGLMKGPVILLLISLLIQYMCDFTFLYQSSQGTWYVGGVNDYMYFVSYFFMTLSLIFINATFKEIESEQS